MGLLTLTAFEPAWTQKPSGYPLYLNTEQVIGFGPDPENNGLARIYVMHGPLWSIGDGSFGTTQTLAQVKAQWADIPKLQADPGGYDLYVNPRYIIGFGPAPGQPTKSRLVMMHGPYSRIGDGSFIVAGTPAQLAAGWPGVPAQSIPLSALITTGTPSATTFLRGDGAYTTLNQP